MPGRLSVLSMVRPGKLNALSRRMKVKETSQPKDFGRLDFWKRPCPGTMTAGRDDI